MSGVNWDVTASNGYSYIVFYDHNFNKLAHLNKYKGANNDTGIGAMVANSILSSSYEDHSILADENGIYTFNLTYQDGAAFSYIRISAEGKGSDMIVTLNT